MALYEGLNRSRPAEREEPPSRAARGSAQTVRVAPRPAPAAAGTAAVAAAQAPSAWRSLRSQGRDGSEDGDDDSRQAPLLDRVLGSGSSHTLGRAVGGAIAGLRRGAAPAAATAARRPARPTAEPAARGGWSRPRMQAVGTGETALPRGRKGLGRILLVAAGLAFAMAMLRPWQRMGSLRAELGPLFHPASGRGQETQPDPAPDAQAAGADRAQTEAQQQQDREAARQKAVDAAKLAALPLQASTGRPLGLWQEGNGAWFRVDNDGGLAPCPDPASAENLGLPEIRGVGTHSEAWRGGRRLMLNLPDGTLGGLLPLDPGVASEVRALDLVDPAQPVLVTHDAARCLMGQGDWAQRQKRLAMVLADLAARRRRPRLVDLRFEDTAVVRN